MPMTMITNVATTPRRIQSPSVIERPFCFARVNFMPRRVAPQMRLTA
jgi:hypothetical protein